MFQEVLDPLGSKSLTLAKGPTLLESIFRQVGLNPQLPPVKASAFIPNAITTTHSFRTHPPHPRFYPFKGPAAKNGLFH